MTVKKCSPLSQGRHDHLVVTGLSRISVVIALSPTSLTTGSDSHCLVLAVPKDVCPSSHLLLLTKRNVRQRQL